MVQPIYILEGDEAFLIEQFYQQIAPDSALDSEYEVISMDLEEDSIEAMLNEADSYSFFASKRLITVHHGAILSSQTSLKMSNTDKERLNTYFENPNPSSVVIFHHGTSKIDGRKKLTKVAKKQGYVVDVTSPDESKVKQYLQQYLANQNFQLSAHLVDSLLVRVSYSLTQAIEELKKLQLYALSGNEIDEATLTQLVPRTMESDIFKLTNALSAKKYSEAIQIYEDLILLKHEPIAIFGLIISQFRVMLQSYILQRQGYQPSDIAKLLNIHPYRVQIALQNARHISLSSLKNFYDYLAEIDFKLKTGVGMPDNHFYLLITQLHQLYQ